MNNNTFLFFALTIVFSFSCFAQSSDRIPANTKKGNTSLVAENFANNEEYTITSYYVEERVNGNITSYNVSSLNLVEKNDLGPNNTRVVTPKYGKIKTKKTSISTSPKLASIAEINMLAPKSTNHFVAQIEKPKPIDPIAAAAPPVKKKEFVMVDILSTYERILEKGGYESIEMIKKVADNRYFKGELTDAYKWYSQLFSKTTDFEIVYYYRYAQALKAVGQNNKSDEMMKVFETKIKSK